MAKKPVTVLSAYYMVPKNGGFQLRRLTIDDGIVLSDESVSDPDAWNQVLDILDQELSKQFA